MDILIISGFLGAGKTTFIKEMLSHTDVKPVILENEYGDNNLDSLDIEKSVEKGKSPRILEFMEGCVCCTMKDSFINSVLTIFSSLGPDYLIIEPTGVGKLSNILENLKPVTGSAIKILRPVLVISPETFDSNLKEWPELYTDQISNAEIIVFSKCEHTSSEIIDDVSSKIREINPHAKILDRHYTQMPDSWWHSLLYAEKNEPAPHSGSIEAPADNKTGIPSDPDRSLSFSQISINQAGLHNPGELIQFLDDCLRGEFGLVARAKGTLWVGNEFLRFDLADKMYAITCSSDDSCQCVVIGNNLSERKIRQRLCPQKYHSRHISL